MEYFNYIFGTDKSFEECFEGREIKDETFKSFYDFYSETRMLALNSIEILPLLQLYENYRSILSLESTFTSVTELVEAVEQQVSEFGRPTLFYGKPTNRKIQPISMAEIEAVNTYTTALFEKSEKELETLTKSHKKASRILRKKQTEQSFFDVQKIEADIHKKMVEHQKIHNLVTFAEILNARILSSNTDIDKRISTKIAEKFGDLICGIPIIGGKRLEFSSTYIHELEKEELFRLFKEFNIENPFKSPDQSSNGPKKE